MKIYIHCCCKNHWKIILKELLDEIQVMNLNNFATIYVGSIGDKFDFTHPIEFQHIRWGDDVTFYEFPTLWKLWSDAVLSDKNYPIFYCHTKGAVNKTSLNESWRKIMVNACITNFKICLDGLLNANASGILVKRDFFAGNFWWTKSSYVKTCLNPFALEYNLQNRFNAECYISQTRKFMDQNYHLIDKAASDFNAAKSYYIKNPKDYKLFDVKQLITYWPDTVNTMRMLDSI